MWTREDFDALVRSNIEYDRLGKATFRALQYLDPELAEIIRGTIADPFYASKPTDARLVRFNHEIWGDK